MPSKSQSGASVSRLRRAPAPSTNETPAFIVTVRDAVVSNCTQFGPTAVNGRSKRATKCTV
jgi:hypothetical protein